MCMICNKSDFKRKVAEECIHCYKVMRYQDGEYYAPYLDMRMELNVRYDNHDNEDIKDELNNSDIWFRNWKEYTKIKSGFFHSYVNYESADYFAQQFNANRIKGVEYHIIDCVIPKSSEYIEGFEMCHNQPTYASKSIILNEIVFPTLHINIISHKEFGYIK